MQELVELGKALLEHESALVTLGNIELLLLVAAAFATMGRRHYVHNAHARVLRGRVDTVLRRAG